MKKPLFILRFLVVLVLSLFLLPGSQVAASDEEPPTLDTLSAEQVSKSYDHASVLSALETETTARLILKLDVPDFVGTAGLDGTAEAEAMGKIDRTQTQFSDAFGSDLTEGMVTFEYIPYVSVWVENLDEYVSLLASPMVVSVQQDIPTAVDDLEFNQDPAPAAMAQAIPWISADEAHTQGHDGDGWTVAILDTGVDKDHAFLDSGKVVSEACYSTTYSNQGLSLCPGGAASSTAVNSAEPYNTGVCANYRCDHGTHVAGIAAGTHPGFTGVAPHADLIAIQVFSYFPGQSNALSWDTDQISGLNRVYALRNIYNIASVNMSLGGGLYSSACNSDARAAIIGNLKSAGIATVIATGNNGYTGFVGAPSCISDAIAVGATGDVDAIGAGDIDDIVAKFSNAAANMVDVWAPGVNITSSVPTEMYGAGAPTATWKGTSMATPIVAGAWAVIKEAYPAYSVDQVYALIDTYGVSVTDQRSGGVAEAPRIDFTNALPVTVPTLLTPTGSIEDHTPDYTWTKVDGATMYKLELYRGSSKIYTLWPKDKLCGATECTKTYATPLSDGDYTWRMQSYVGGDWKPWSSSMAFTVITDVPDPDPVPTLLTPTGNIEDNTPTYTWTKVDGATKYKLELYRGSSMVYALWPKDKLCGATECTKSYSTALSDGDYTWRMQAYVGGAWKQWSSPMAFTLLTETPAAIPVPISPDDEISTNTPSYVWSKVDGASMYQLELYKGSTRIYTLWPKDKVCDATECTRTPATALDGGEYRWRVKAYTDGIGTAYSGWMTFSVGWTSLFESDAAGWTQVSGEWAIVPVEGGYRTEGILSSNSSVVHEKDYSTLTYEVNMRRTGDSLAANRIFVQGRPDPLWSENRWQNGYLFQYTNNGNFSVWKYVNGVSSAVADWTPVDGIIADDFNTLKVTAFNGLMKFYINDQKVWEGTDTDLTIGQVGIGMYKNAEGTYPLTVAWAKFYPESISGAAVDETFAVVGEPVTGWDNPDVGPEN